MWSGRWCLVLGMLFVLAGVAGAAPESAGPRVVSVDLRSQVDEGAYYVVFFKRGPWPGHAFVGLGTEDPGAAQSKFRAFGLYPRGGLPAAAASWVVGEVPASLVDETRHGSLRAVTDQLICRVSRTSYDAAERVRADWVASTALPSEAQGAEGYELLRQDCVTFTAEIARAIALKVPPRSRTKYPQDLIDELITAATEMPATLPPSPPPAEAPPDSPSTDSGIFEGTWGGAIRDGDLGKKVVSDATVTLSRAPDGTWSGEFAMLATHRGISERLQLTLSRGVATTAGLHFPPGQSVTRSESSPLGTESKTMTDETSTDFTLDPDGRLRMPFQNGFSFLLSRRLPDGQDARKSSVVWITLAPGQSASIGSVRFDFLGFRRSGKYLCACGRITNLSDSRVLKGSKGMSMFTGSQFIGFRFGNVKDEFGNDVPHPGGFSEADYYETLGALGLAKVVRDFYLKRDENTSNGLMPGQSWADFTLIGSPLIQKAISFSMPCEVETLQGTARLILRFTRDDMTAAGTSPSARGAAPTPEAPSAPRTTGPAPSAPRTSAPTDPWLGTWIGTADTDGTQHVIEVSAGSSGEYMASLKRTVPSPKGELTVLGEFRGRLTRGSLTLRAPFQTSSLAGGPWLNINAGGVTLQMTLVQDGIRATVRIERTAQHMPLTLRRAR